MKEKEMFQKDQYFSIMRLIDWATNERKKIKTIHLNYMLVKKPNIKTDISIKECKEFFKNFEYDIGKKPFNTSSNLSIKLSNLCDKKIGLVKKVPDTKGYPYYVFTDKGRKEFDKVYLKRWLEIYIDNDDLKGFNIFLNNYLKYRKK